MLSEILLLPEKSDPERDAVAEAWKAQGGEVRYIAKFWQKPSIGSSRISIYGNDTFALVLAQVLGKQLLMPQDEVIASVSDKWTKRTVSISDTQKITQLNFPIFAKPVQPKLFKAAVYQSEDDLNKAIQGLENPLIICSEVVNIDKEIRVFVLNNELMDLAYYEGQGDLIPPKAFVQDFLQQNSLDLPCTYVVDLGFNAEIGWFIIEFNAVWGAGLNGCSPAKVLSCIREATIN